MAIPDPTIELTPGKNEIVSNVFQIEDILHQTLISDQARQRSMIDSEHGEKIAAIQQLVSDLEKKLGELRTKSL
jgi:hypothetical protein